MKTKSKSENRSYIHSKKLRAVQVAVLLLSLTAATNWAQSYTILHNFNDGSSARYPSGRLLVSGGVLFGSAYNSNQGLIFRMNTNGTDYTIIKEFTGSDGAGPGGGLVLSGSTFYGVTGSGGSSNYGTVFQMNTNGTGHLVLKHFTGSDGRYPNEGLLLSGGTLYGTTSWGGSSNKGTVFKLNTDGSGFALLKAFHGTDGSDPIGGLVLSGTTLFGATKSSTGGSGGSTIFKVTTDGSGFAVLKQLSGTEGGISSPLALADTNLYGSAYYRSGSGSETGTVFRLSTDGSSFAVLQNLTFIWPEYNMGGMSSPILSGSTLYATTRGVDPHDPKPNNFGAVFRLNTDGSDYTVLQRFDFTNGSNPGLLTLSGATLYGTTTYGGTSNQYDLGRGVVFSLSADPLTIVLQPVSQTVPPGTTIEFQVEATGEPPLAYQWFFNGTNAIEAATSPLLTLTNVQFSHSGGYTVVITNASGSVTSIVATLTAQDPCITAQPVSQSVNVGGSVAFTVDAGGTSPLSYQWFKGGNILSDGGNISGSQSSMLTLSDILTGDAGGYSASVSNPNGSVTSLTATLVVIVVPPSIIRQPVSQFTNLGASVFFSVQAEGSPPLGYQWFKGGNIMTDGGNISGAQTPMLTLANVVGGDAGGYSVLVSNASGSMISLVATLQVVGTPFITTQPTSRSTNFGATVQFSVVAGGTPPLSYQWFKDVTNLSNSGNISGARTPILTLANVAGRDSGGYSVSVSNPYGSVTSLVVALSVADPWITAQPVSQRAALGQSVVFSVGAVGTPPLSYRWRKNGVNLTGQTTSTLALANAQSVDTGNYDVEVGSLYGTAISATAALAVLPQTSGDLDLSFDPGSSLNGQIRGMVVQTNGSYVIVGNFKTVPGAMRNRAARFYADGAVDPEFAPAFAQAGYPYFSVEALALQPDGKMLIGGTFSSVNGVTRSNLVRLHPDGSTDFSFLNELPGPAGPLVTTVVGKIVVQGDGKILVAGSFTAINGMPRTNLARLNADGSLDTSFLNGLVGPNGDVRSIAVQSDGKVLIGGDFTLVNGVSRPKLARLNADGSLDAFFLNGLAGPDGNPSGVAVQTDGRVLIAGRFQAVNGVARTNLTRLNADGSLDPTFPASLQTIGPGGIGPVFVLQGDGRILIGGGFALINGVGRTNLARLHPDGRLDESFLAQLPSMMSTDGGVSAFALQPDGKVLVSGISAFNYSNPYLVRLNADGSPDNTCDPGRTGPNGRIRETAVQPDGRLLIIGDFASVNGVARGGLARLLPNGALDDSFLQGLAGANRGAYTLALQRDGKVVIGGDLDTFNGIARKGIARVNADGALDESFAPNLEGKARAVYSLAFQSDGKILIGGSFTSVNGLARTNLARLNPDGSSDSSFVGSVSGGSSDGVEVLVLQPDGRIVLGGFFSVVNGVSRNRIARLHSDGALDTSFLNGLSGGDQAVWAIALQTDGKVVVGGWFNTINGADRKYLARLNGNGTVDTSFLSGLAGPSGGVEDLLIQSDGKILVAGGFNSFNGVARGNLARLNANGSLDHYFLDGLPGADQKVWCLALLPDSRIVLGGEFAAVNGLPRRSVARVMGDYAPPVIENPAQSQTAEEGNKVKLHITVVGYPPPAIHWFGNGVALSDCTNATLALLNAQPLHSGVYSAIITNAAGAVTSAPVNLNVIAPVERRLVPGINLFGEAGSLLNVDYTDALSPTPDWLPLDVVSLVSTSQYYFDLTAMLPSQRFYRAWQMGTPAIFPSLDLNFVPAITLTGDIGSAVRVEGINQLGPTDAWFMLNTVTLTNTMQLYFDVTAPGQPPRLYRLVPVP